VGIGRLPGGGGTLGVGGFLVVLVLVFVLPRCLAATGFQDLGSALDPFGGGGVVAPGSNQEVNPDDPAGAFADAVLADVEFVWADVFARAGKEYQGTSIVLFRGSTTSACGRASSATGPFYCPADGLIYLDLSFFKELETRFGAPGDFAQAYVIAHEVAHHVQTLLGTNDEVQRLIREDPDLANELSMRLELQADCFAGVWARSAQGAGILEPGDLEEGLNAAAAIGDDRIQEATTGRIDPETFTHGSSEQRVTWLRRGIQVGNPDVCDTFSGDV
jgi:hypothetical protein